MRLAMPACRSHRQRTDAVIFIRRVGFGLLQLVDSFTVYHLFLGILGGMGGPLLCEFESLKSCALDVVEMDGRIYVQGLTGAWTIA